MISGFCHKVDENCALLGYYGVSSGFLTIDDWTDSLSWNVGNELPLLAA